MPLEDVTPAALLGVVAARYLQAIEERISEVGCEQFFCELNDATRVLNHLHRLDASQVVEEPAAARVHKHRVTLQLHELERPDALVLGQLPAPVSLEPGVH